MTGCCRGEVLTALVDGALDHQTRERAYAHLAGCATCHDALEAERDLKRRLTGVAGRPPAPSDALIARLLGLAVPGVEPAAYASPSRIGRPVRLRRAGPRRSTRAQGGRLARARGRRAPAVAAGPLGRAPDHRDRGRSHRLLRTGAVGGSLILLGLTAALVLGGSSRPTSPPVDPATDAFVIDFVATSTDVPPPRPTAAAVTTGR